MGGMEVAHPLAIRNNPGKRPRKNFREEVMMMMMMMMNSIRHSVGFAADMRP